jgi:hypothetical protein
LATAIRCGSNSPRRLSRWLRSPAASVPDR